MSKENRGPGRPKKPIVRKQIEKVGIVSRPSNYLREEDDPQAVYVLEMVYDHPPMFKQIFKLLKVMDVESMRMKFDKRRVCMYAASHENKNKIYVEILGERLNRYYVEEPIEFSCDPNRIFDKIMNPSKDHASLSFTIPRDSKDSSVIVTLFNDQMDEDSVDYIDIDKVEAFNWDIHESLDKEEYYPIRFTLPSKYFKKKMVDISKSCEILRIEKNGSEPLRFSYNHQDKRGRHDTIFKDGGKINLVSHLEEDEIFSTSVYLENIKTLSSALIADEIHISASREHDLIFTAYLDQDEHIAAGKTKKITLIDTEKCMIKVVTDIVRSKAYMS